MISSIKIIVELFAYLYCLAGLFGKKFRLSIHAMILLALDLFLLTGINEYGFPEYLRSLIYVGMFLYGLLYYKESIKVTLVNSIFGAVIISILQALMYLPVFFLFIKELGYRNELEIVINLGCLFIVLFPGIKIKLNALSKFFINRNVLLLGLSIFVVIVVGINLYKEQQNQFINGENYTIMVYTSIFMLFILNEWQKSRVDAEKKKTQLEMNELYYGAYDQLIMVIRDRQHDMKNHISAILSMIHTTNKYEDLVTKQQEYCGYVMGQNEKTKLLLSSGNPLITGFLYSKILEAEEKGIDVEYSIEIKKDIKFPEYELVEMLGILLDNAIEALEKVQISKKCLQISVKEEQEKIKVLVANNGVDCKKENINRFFDRGYSSKGENRGIGLPKLKYLVDGKKGDLIVYNEKYKEEDFLMFEIVLPKMEKEK
ncbi:MAG: GHKL domain-containing protein [Lachnospiraceae bacterium]|nr:GHKL domain-containing protein [Lachnospiraceae bacterium]